MSLICKLLTLPDELLSEVISYCSVEDIVRLEVTCKHLHSVCNTRTVWLDLLYGLDVECAPDLPPHHSLESLTLSDLRVKVTDAIRRFHAWRNPEKLRVLYEVALRIEPPNNGSDLPMEARLLPGGRELLIINCGRLELWSLELPACVWHIPPFFGRLQCSSFDFELVQNGTVVMIVGEFISAEQATTYLRVFRYEIVERSAELVYDIGLPYTNLFRLTIRDEFCMAFLPHHFQTVLINWKSGRGVFLDFVDSMGQSINDNVRSPNLYDGHLLVTAKLPTGFCVVSFPLSILDEQWSSDTDYRAWRSFPYNPESGSILTLSPPDDEGPWMLTTHVFKPTWKKNAPAEMYIVAYSNIWDSPKVFLSFRLQLSSSESSSDGCRREQAGSLTAVLKSVVRTSAVRLPWDSHCISNSGHIICLRESLRCFSLFSEAQQPMAELELDIHKDGSIGPILTVEPWSGAVVASMEGAVRVFRLK